jgi:WD40 repeat protein
MKLASAALAVALASCLVLLPRHVVADDRVASKKEATSDKLVTLAWFPSFSPDGKWLVTAHGSWRGEEGGEVRVWNVTTGKVRHTVPSPRGVRAVIWSPNSPLKYSA